MPKRKPRTMPASRLIRTTPANVTRKATARRAGRGTGTGADPVVDADGAVSGIVSYVDVLRAIYADDSDIRSPCRRRGSAELP